MKSLFEPWSFMRILRLVMGVIIVYQSFMGHQPLLGILGCFFVLQVLLNAGCGAGSCNLPMPNKTVQKKVDEIDYEDIH